ncbi:tetratricopeptide repeat-containing hybrid sensor histidine kinase/response regulator [Abyssalbus ytuae]|uniref:histidine kinase n=1 Tax=Abyssalbus ytuae TaxID=2926907 RepID=A0A9E7A1S3_9FLAO|nr:response regulator [Abyssalbus ytuae]UOB18141.1 ATP-binding protein [Abyssalbus ytuae]
MRPATYIYLFIFLFSPSLFSQELISISDSLLHLKKKVYEFKNEGSFEKAMITLNNGVKLAESTESHKDLIDFYNLYIQLHTEYNKYDKARVYMTMAYSVLNYYNYPEGKALTNAFEALTLLENDPEEALAIIENIKSNITLEDKNNAICVNYIEGLINLKQKNYQTAQQIFEKILPVEHEFEKDYIRANTLLQLAKINYETSKFINGEIEASTALNVANEYNYPLIKIKAHHLLANIYENGGNYEKALSHFKSLTAIHNQVFTQETLKNNEDIAVKTESDFFSRILDQMNKDAIAQQQTVNISKLTSVLSSALLIIISLLTISLYRNNQIKYKTNDLLLKKNLELQIAKEEAEKAMQAKAQFLSTVSHELRTPLYAVTGLTHLLLEDNPNSSQKEHLKSLKFSGEYLLNFINDILQINKIEANKLKPENIPFDLRKVLNEVVNTYQQTAKESNNELVLKISDDIPSELIGDPIKLSQIFTNLVGNALKFTENGHVKVIADVKKSDFKNILVHFEVQDDGIGISKKMQTTIFDSFSQGSEQINRKYGGTGLGLAIVKSLLSLFGSEITLESELGRGTAFYFDIDFGISKTTQEEPEKVKTSLVNDDFFIGKRVLVVEDNKINQVITTKILAKKQMSCDIASNGYEALDKVHENQYDVILMDIHMPGISGLKTTEEIRKFNTEIPVIALTAISLDESKDDFYAAGCNDIITKPFKPEEFYETLAKNMINNSVSSES